ncbi:TPA: filamentous hemagglutinin N-terminal domain-containing protein [Pseudomonas aeruginosa]|nr:filamentous hemagglutinin N-terminal domain-containing protein [Pseudomonas aeruginosa]
MNRSYALVWNQATGCWNVASEGTRRRGKSGRGTLLAIAGASLLNLLGLPEAFALPSDGKIVNGQGSINTSVDGKHMTIDQQSQKLIAHWNGFDIAADERVSFQQQNSNAIALNRVLGNDGSKILGKLDANGKVFLINPNGVMFGKTAQVNVGGLVASTLDISDKDFLDGNYRFSGKSGASVSNAGTLSASEGGSIALLGARVDNSGVVQARLGSVALGAGQDVSLNFDGDGLLNLQVNAGAVDALAHNGGLLKADGGQVLMTARSADSLLKTVVSNQGVIEAKTLQNKSGRIVLDAGDGGAVLVAGRQDASALGGQGDGGVVENRGGKVEVQLAAQVDTQADQGRTGTWKIRSNEVDVAQTATRKTPTLLADTLSRNLGSTHIELTSKRGNLKVDAPVSWNSANKLSLNAEQGDVELNGTIKATGNGAGLALNARNEIRQKADITLSGQNTALSLNYGKRHSLQDDARVTLSGKGASFRANDQDYKVVQSLQQLREIDRNLGERYVLGNAIDGGNTSFLSLGNGRAFTGIFDGLGNEISNLAVYGTSAFIGLFSNNHGTLRNLYLDRVEVSGSRSTGYNNHVGTLAGANIGTIHNVKVSNARVTGSAQNNALGGLVGLNLGRIDQASASGQLIGNGRTYAIGGLVGENISTANGIASIDNSQADVIISGRMSSDSTAYGAGGLVGNNREARISNSRASGSLNLAGNNLNLGGLVGRNYLGELTNASSSASVSGSGRGGLRGGLVGFNEKGTLTNVSARGNVNGAGAVAAGGLVGHNEGGTLTNASAEGDVSGNGTDSLGGLVGKNVKGTLSNVSASGNVADKSGRHLGGLIGSSEQSTVTNAKARGDVNGMANDARVGGLIGSSKDTLITNAQASGKVRGGIGAFAGGLVGLLEGSSKVANSSASGDVEGGTSSHVGGLVGTNYGSIENSSASGSVTSNQGQSLGGLVGINMGSVRNSSASGKVVAQNPLFIHGGLIGLNLGGQQSQNTLLEEAKNVPMIGRDFSF